ncbi:dihydrodipicolinate synthase family protein, partial [bacterium AH-315-E10]|nr:dihydrodipicolinate synthase family protein [bacterium AH-315-E10]
KKMIDLGIEGGTHVSLLTAGNSMLMHLSQDETRELTQVMVDQVQGRTLTVAATPFCSARDAVELAEFAVSIGVDMIMPTPFVYNDPNAVAEGLIDFYRRVSDVMPTMIVGAPPVNVLEQLSECPNVVAFKEDGSEIYAMEAAARFSDRYIMLTGGQYSRHLSQRPFGVGAYFCSFLCFRPDISRQFETALQTDDMDHVIRTIRDKDMALFQLATGYPGGFQAVWRAILKLHGVAEDGLRSPLHALEAKEISRLEKELKSLGLL